MKLTFQEFLSERYEGIPAISLNIKKCKKEYEEYLKGVKKC